MDSLTRLACLGLVLVTAALPTASHATCWQSGSGPTAVYRQPSVTAEFKDTPLVITGRAVAARNISAPDDPEGYAWTVYTVQVLAVFKGNPQQTIRLLSENSSARFYMDIGKAYLLFVSHSRSVDTDGKEHLPADYIDNCGNSAPAGSAESAIETVRDLSKVR